MSKILGLDLGTNSIGWCLVDDTDKKIIKAGSRIIPMDAAAMSDYERGNLQSQASVRTGFRGTRRLYQRAELRRERLLRVLHVLGWLPKHFDERIDWVDHPGQFKDKGEPLLPYRKGSDGKNNFIFNDSFQEMLDDFNEHHPELLTNGRRVPYDWTIYYLRDKALRQPIRRDELAWILLNFNTKRGYYQLRGKDEFVTEDEPKDKREEYARLRVKEVNFLEPDQKKKGYNWYNIVYEGDITQRAHSINEPHSVGDEVELIITTKLDKNGGVKLSKDGLPMITVRSPKEDDWQLMKKRSENAITKSGFTVGSYIYKAILADPAIKVRGKLVRVIERDFYRKELIAILTKQMEFIPELASKDAMAKCVAELYHNNEAHVASLADKTLASLFVDDIIFYQRPLKSKKSEIANCPLEHYHYINRDTGEIVEKPIKCIPKSHPLFQEFRLWQFVRNVSILQREKYINGKLRTDVDVTGDFITSPEDMARLFGELNELGSIRQKSFLGLFGLKPDQYRWNYSEDKELPCNETHHDIVAALHKTAGEPTLTYEQELKLWHILYSVDDIIELRKALARFAGAASIDTASFVDSFLHFKSYESDFGAYSERAISRLLPLMRVGKYWSADRIDAKTRQRIDKLITGIDDETIAKQVRENAIALTSVEDFQGLPLWLASYVVYNRHSEAIDTTVWKSPKDIDYYLKFNFRNHALRNPIVEKILGEMLRVVRDIWDAFGKIDEVHVEMGRDLKSPAKKRAAESLRMADNERTNMRIRVLLQEFVNPEYNISNVRPMSPSQHEILKIYEDYALTNGEEVPDDIETIKDAIGNTSKPVAKSDIMRYRLWLEQRYRSPYTGDIIPLSKLFTPAYEIEHVIPQARYFDNSLSNKVICESEVNKLKDCMLGYEFILNKGGSVIKGSFGKEIHIFTKTEYEEFVRENYRKNPIKMRKLLSEDIPKSFIQRQMNDTRYIARKTIELLSHLVREDGEKEATSKNVIVTSGSITDRLKKEWGLNDVWNDIVAPRFERLNTITGSSDFGEWVNMDGKRFFRTNVPLAISLGFSKKRIDHRHHAMDAMVIACTTRNHVNYLNNSSAAEKNEDHRFDLRNKLCYKDKALGSDNYTWRFVKPWDNFTADAKRELQSIIVSFKQNLRVVTRTTNSYWHYENGRKVLAKQKDGDGWAVRNSLHKATVAGAIRLQEKKKVRLADALLVPNLICDEEVRNVVSRAIGMYKCFDQKTILKYIKDNFANKVNGQDIRKVEIWHIPEQPTMSATRVSLDDSFDKEKIESVSDSGIRKILLAHLGNYDGDSKAAFSPEGIAAMNRDIKVLNGGMDHKPILKVRKTETLGEKFPVGYVGSKSTKFVEADTGTNLFFAIYINEEGKRSFESIPFRVAVERRKAGLPVAPERNGKNEKLLFVLSPNDLVYVPEEGEHVDSHLNLKRIYKMVSCYGNCCCFVPERVAFPILKGKEFGSLNKVEIALSGENIKVVCKKIIVNRLGIIKKIEQ